MHTMTFGSHANAWNATAVAINGTSAEHFIADYRRVTAFGNSGGAATITLQYSQDGAAWYSGPNVVLAGAGDFFIQADACAKYVRLKSSAAATITATISAKN